MTTLPSLNPAQVIIRNMETPSLIYQGGQGSGKSTSGALACIMRASICPPGTLFGAVSPTYQMANRNVLQTLEDECRRLGLPYKWSPGRREFRVLNAIIQITSADRPSAIAGTWSFAWLDESGQMDTDAFKEVDGRLRGSGLPIPQVFMTSTPNGTRTRQQELIREAEAGAGSPKCPVSAVIAPTLINRRHLPPAFLERLVRTYTNDPAGRSNRILGIAADAAGGIYTNLQQRHVRPYKPAPDDVLVLGWDFNVHWMVTTLAMYSAKQHRLHFLGSVTSKGERATTTEQHARVVHEAVAKTGAAAFHNGQWANKSDLSQVTACIDATGATPDTRASWTDETLVRAAGFRPRHGGSNPRVKDRIEIVQYNLAHDHVFFDPQATDLLRAVREHPYDKDGSPKKWHGYKDGDFQCDHYTDCAGYAICTYLPMRRLTWR